MRSSSKLLFSNHFQATVVNKDASIVVKTTILLNIRLFVQWSLKRSLQCRSLHMPCSKQQILLPHNSSR